MGGAWIMYQHNPDDKSLSNLRNLHELRGKRLVAQVSQTRRYALYSRAGVVLMLRLESSWHGRSVDHVSTYSGRQILVGSQKPSRITRKKTCCATESNTSVRVVFANGSGFDAPIGVVLAWEERGSCLNIFRMTNLGRISETFPNYEAKDMLRKSVDHILTYCEQQITVGSQKPSRITRQKTCCTSESNTSIRVVFANRSSFDAPIGVVFAWEERGSCPNIFRTTNCGRITETFTNYEAKDLRRKNLHELRGKRLVAQVSQTRQFANQSGFDAPIRVISAWEERGSCLSIFRTRKRGRISEAFTNCEAKDLLRKSVHHVLTYSRRQIAVGSQKPSRITWQKTCCASESYTSVCVVFAHGSGFDAPIGVVLAWEERGSCLNIFRTTNRGRISETFTNYEAKDLLRNESNTSVRAVFANRSGFDAPIGVVLGWEERGSCLNIFRTTNRGRISETFMNYEGKDLLRKNLHELRGKRLVAQVSKTHRFALYSRIGVVLMLRLESSWHGKSMDHVLTYSSGFDAPIGAVLAWEDLGSCLNMFRMTNRGRISETFTNYEAKDLLRKSVDHVLTYSGRQIAVGSLKISRITRQKTCYASESNTSVGVVFANWSGFDAPIGVVLAWEERG
ncbi:uncharacterized protein G2W53_009857 [Senna tora]|uniref:Uncharacterized protein n=1 Tax=Senna tora TaxID=362788 RepID=A0A834WYW0_9FABA|nr:uncharacterized protein G2W53_009857 [Senna tora]